MLIIDKDDFELYRYTVAKIVFLKLYSNEFRFIKNISNSNCFILQRNKEEKVLVSLFREPETYNEKGLPILVFYQKGAFSKNQSKHSKENYEIYQFKNEFDNAFNYSIGNVLINPSLFINGQYDEYGLLEEIKVNARYFHDTTGSLFKYYSADSVIKKNYGIPDGNISFMNPCTFNDPFDCDCFTDYNQDVSNKFRVLCTIPQEKDILMWAYYGDNHKGYCFEYSKHDIINSILSLPSTGICIIGKVDYKKKRPKYRSNGKSLSYSNLKFLIDCTFTKYEKWAHEQEFRFVIIDETLRNENEKDIALQINVPIINIFNGCEGNSFPIYDKKGKQLKVNKLSKDLIDYLLK